MHIQLQLLGNDIINALAVQHFGHFINAVCIVAAHHRALFHVTEQGYFAALFFGQNAVHAANQHIGLNTDFAQLFHRVLGGLGFDFARRRDIRYIAQMHIQGVAAPQLAAHLADGFQKRQRFDIAHGTADFYNGHIVSGRAFVDFAFDFVGNMRNHLHGAAQVVAAAFFGNHLLIHLAGTETITAQHGGIDKTLVVAEVEVGFRAVFGYKHFSVLKRAHGAGIDVDIGIELEHGDIQAARFENGSNRSGGDTFTQ